MNENKFFYKGKFFTNEKDFWDYVLKYNSEQISDESLEQLCQEFSKDLLLNIKISNISINVSEMRFIFECLFFKAMNLIMNKK